MQNDNNKNNKTNKNKKDKFDEQWARTCYKTLTGGFWVVYSVSNPQ